MIYANLLYFLAAIVIFASAPDTPNQSIPVSIDIFGIILLTFFFWRLNKHIFGVIRTRYENGDIGSEYVKRYFTYRLNIHMIMAIAIFAAEIYFFDLKSFFAGNPLTRNSETLLNTLGLAFFMLLLSIAWYWAHRALGDILEMGGSARNYVIANIKFNLAIVLPWLFFSLLIDILGLINIPWLNELSGSFIFQAVLLILFLFIVATFAPLFITLLWDCNPMPESSLTDSIKALCRAEGVKFRSIMKWGALNGTLVTAGVVGLVPRFRYLLITPQLEQLLDEREILAVVSHEIAHVKKRHILYYLLFFSGFALLALAISAQVYLYFADPTAGLELILGAGLDMGMVNTMIMIMMVIFFFLYFRFVFGFFMRNFERQADTYVFDTGIGAEPMISSFMKLGVEIGDDSRKKNWHHYNIAQRIDFIRKCAAEPGLIKEHNKRINRSLTAFFASLVLVIALAFPFSFPSSSGPLDEAKIDKIFSMIQKVALVSPEEVNPNYVNAIASVYYELERWGKTRQAYELSLNLEYNQPEVLNNLSWLLVTCPDTTFREPEKALLLAREAVRLSTTGQAHIYDTLAETLAANKFYKEAVEAAKKAMEIAEKNGTQNSVNDLQFYKDRLKEMKDRYLESQMIRI